VGLKGVEKRGGLRGSVGAEDGLGQVAVGGVATELQGSVELAAAGIWMRHLSSVSQRGCQSEGAKYSKV
jgi:hypothetical protein